jgi:hypothetical protein
VESSRIKIFGFLSRARRNAEALLLAARDVGAPLLDVGVVLLGELLDKLVCLRELAGLEHLLVGCVGVAPTEVVLDGAREEDVSLEHDRHLVAKGVEVVLAHVSAANAHGSLGCVVEAADELHER